jgi:indolepyruvate decarboxylase
LLLKVVAARGFFAQPSYSSIGYVVPAATGVCLAKADDERVMVFTGDGGFQMTAFALATQARLGLDPIIFVMDNGVFAVEQWLANAAVYASPDPKFEEGLDVYRCSYSNMKDVVGCKGRKVTNYGDLKDAIECAWNNRESPSIIQVVVDPKSIPANALWKVSIDAARVN